MAYAFRHHLHMDGTTVERMQTTIGAMLQLYDEIDDLDESAVSLRHGTRDPGRRPRADEDPYNAFIRFCEVRGVADGVLFGNTLGVKDSIAVAGVPLTNGGRRTPVIVPIEDAVVVERMLDAGVVITGKTNLDDMALGLGEGSGFGATLNPRNPAFIAGGSSSGSAAAVAALEVDLALGADSAGSIRIPAAWCGVVGMKATHGLVPSYGLTYMDHTADHIGPITRSVRESALMLEVMAGGDWRDPQWVRRDPSSRPFGAGIGEGIEGLRIGIVAESLGPSGCSAEVLEAFSGSVERLASLGASVSEISIPLWTKSTAIGVGSLALGLYGMAISNGMGFGHLGRMDPVVATALGAQRSCQAGDFPEMLSATILTTEHVLSAYHGLPIAKCHNLRLDLRRQVGEVMSGVDVMLTPTTPGTAFPLLGEGAPPEERAKRLQESVAACCNTMPLNLTGQPALTLPCGIGGGGLPIGLQIVGSHFHEEVVYRVASALEEDLCLQLEFPDLPDGLVR